jgi:multisubunit Na+/H+ antiporter MnhF subunit
MSLDLVLYACIAVQVLSVILAGHRLTHGPTSLDRVMIFDLLTSVGVSILLTFMLLEGSSLFLDVALLLAFVSFNATVALARYLEKGDPRG